MDDEIRNNEELEEKDSPVHDDLSADGSDDFDDFDDEEEEDLEGMGFHEEDEPETDF